MLLIGLRRIFTSKRIGKRVRKWLSSGDLVGNYFSKPVERVIWIYWAQGLKDAPEIVQYCIRSWQRQNPSWKVMILDDGTLHDFVDMSDLEPDINRTAYSDILRCRLLRKHGGVWTDATVLCATPLDQWLHAFTYGGFFAYSWPGRDRPIASWFLASVKNGALITRLASEVDDYWANGRSNPSTYFWLHFTFLYLTSVDRTFRKNWKRTPQVSAFVPHILQRMLTGGPVGKYHGALLSSPVHKLTWKHPISIKKLEETFVEARRALHSDPDVS